MEGYIASVKNDTLRVSLIGSDVVAEKKVESGLSSHEVLAKELGDLIIENFGPKPKKLPLHFLISPEDIQLNFLTTSKGNVDENHLFELAKSKLGAQGLAIENLYFSYQKIAPFVYQLVSMEKEILEKYIQVATDLEFELKSLIPWVLLLPRRSAAGGDPSIFVLNGDHIKHLVLSELGGIYHLGSMDQAKSADELEELIQKLSIYQRNTPITSIYTLNISDLNLGDKYKISALDIPDLHAYVAEAFADPYMFNSQLNLLTMLPLPVVEKRPSSMVYVGGVIGALLLVGSFFGIRALNNKAVDGELAGNLEETPVVLSEAEEATQSTPEATETEGSQEEDKGVELNKAYLRVRIENGTSIGGLAGRTRDELVAAGYDVVSIGDSAESARVVTQVTFSPENVIYKDLLLADLESLFGSFEVLEDLDSDLEYDVLIVAGSNDGDAQ